VGESESSMNAGDLIGVCLLSLVGIVFWTIPLRGDVKQDRPIRRGYLRASCIALWVTGGLFLTSRLLGTVQALEYGAALSSLVAVFCFGLSNVWTLGDDAPP
jgi:hypothetical protein